MQLKPIITLFILLICIFMVSSEQINIPVVDETFSINIPLDVKNVLKEEFRKPRIEKENIIKVDGWNTVNFILSYERFINETWVNQTKEFNLWKDYNIESKYCLTYSELNPYFCIEWGQYTYSELAEIKIKSKIKTWAFKEYKQMINQDEYIDIGEKTIDLGGSN